MLVRQVRQERDAPQRDQDRPHDKGGTGGGVQQSAGRRGRGRLVGAPGVARRARRRLHRLRLSKAASFLLRRGSVRLRAGSAPRITLGPHMISLQHVTKVYRNGTTALEDVTVEVEKGEFVFIVGQSGSGKSTFIRLLLKEEEASKGDIYVAGKNLARLTTWKVPHLRRNIGTVFQDFKLLQDKHVIDQRVPEILELVGLGDKLNNFPDELSGGEQQRVSIARACVNRPLVLLADEPTGNLDPSTSVEIMRLLDKVNRIGTTIVMATHDQAIVDAMRRRVIELDRGKVVRDQARGVYS